jgi:hypothetical protein
MGEGQPENRPASSLHLEIALIVPLRAQELLESLHDPGQVVLIPNNVHGRPEGTQGESVQKLTPPRGLKRFPGLTDNYDLLAVACGLSSTVLDWDRITPRVNVKPLPQVTRMVECGCHGMNEHCPICSGTGYSHDRRPGRAIGRLQSGSGSPATPKNVRQQPAGKVVSSDILCITCYRIVKESQLRDHPALCQPVSKPPKTCPLCKVRIPRKMMLRHVLGWHRDRLRRNWAVPLIR